ncbi:heme exporter protein D [Microbacterium resistens]|uniref:Heme exporter protein D n=1 Tax=Microbacterium resistens TaxID=156977 RepID=A0ABU1SAU9_9MICO|nr:hypothetical protein [Microbacterium resistens]MDR6865987.1 heme exporter protein D [Microbacterium resistens]
MTNPEQPGPVPGAPVPPSVPAYPGEPAGQSAPVYPPQQPTAPGQPYPGPATGYATPPAPVPGRGLAITGFVLAFLLPLVGMIISIVATVKLRRIGAPSGLSIAGIIIGAILTIVWIVVGLVVIAVVAAIIANCAQYGPGVWDVDGTVYTCG